MVAPVAGGRARTGRFTIRRAAPSSRAGNREASADDREQIPLEAAFSLGDSYPLAHAEGPVGLLCLPDRLVAVTSQAVSVYAWHKPDEGTEPH